MTASVAAFEGQIGQTSYTASKAAVHGMTICAARDLASWQIRVNTIAPGVIDTAMLSRLRDDIRDGLAASVPHPTRLGKNRAPNPAHKISSVSVRNRTRPRKGRRYHKCRRKRPVNAQT